MKSKDPAHFQPYDWSQSGRPIQPYRLDPVTIAADRDDAWNQNQAHDLVDLTTQPYLNEPIHTKVLKLATGGGLGFSLFAMEFGLHEFLDWAVTETGQGWDPPGSFTRLIDLLERYDTGFRHFTHEELTNAWTSLPEGVVHSQTRALRDAFDFAERSTGDDDPALAIRGVFRRGWEVDPFHIYLDLDETTDTPVIYERPRNIWARAWFELVEDLRSGRLVKTCLIDGEYFVPRRRNRKFCSDRCRNTAYDRKRARDPERRKARHAEYLKRKEAAIKNPPPIERPNGQDQ